LFGLRFRRVDWAVAAGMALLNWAGDAACLALSLTAAGLALPPRDLLLVWSAGVAAGSVYLTPGGMGTVDVALVAALAGFGVPAAGGVVGVFIYRLISLWLVLLAGWVVFLFIGFRRSRRAVTQAEPPSSLAGPGGQAPPTRNDLYPCQKLVVGKFAARFPLAHCRTLRM
jgi:putative heme transporter